MCIADDVGPFFPRPELAPAGETGGYGLAITLGKGTGDACDQSVVRIRQWASAMPFANDQLS
jgi:hypothetical protein